MKNSYIIPIVVLVGAGVLFFFPKPQSNFLAYVGTALLFGIIIIVVSHWNSAKKGSGSKT